MITTIRKVKQDFFFPLSWPCNFFQGSGCWSGLPTVSIPPTSDLPSFGSVVQPCALPLESTFLPVTMLPGPQLTGLFCRVSFSSGAIVLEETHHYAHLGLDQINEWMEDFSLSPSGIMHSTCLLSVPSISQPSASSPSPSIFLFYPFSCILSLPLFFPPDISTEPHCAWNNRVRSGICKGK